MNIAPNILIIDDEPQMQRLLEISLQSAGYRVHIAVTGQQGLEQAAMVRPELVVLDLGLPDLDGIEVLKRMRAWSTTPVLILSVRSTEQDIVTALDAGADDYLTKPFRTGELLARVRTALRRKQVTEHGTIFTFESVSVDLGTRTVTKDGKPVKLTATEYSLLSLLVRNAGKVLTHNFILREVWGPTFAEETQYLRVYIGQLRRKLETDPALPHLILTESGVGYRLAPEK